MHAPPQATYPTAGWVHKWVIIDLHSFPLLDHRGFGGRRGTARCPPCHQEGTGHHAQRNVPSWLLAVPRACASQERVWCVCAGLTLWQGLEGVRA